MVKKNATSSRYKQISTAIGGVFGLMCGYAFFSRALSTGSFIQYFLAILFFVLGTKLIIRAYKTYHDRH